MKLSLRHLFGAMFLCSLLFWACGRAIAESDRVELLHYLLAPSFDLAYIMWLPWPFQGSIKPDASTPYIIALFIGALLSIGAHGVVAFLSLGIFLSIIGWKAPEESQPQGSNE